MSLKFEEKSKSLLFVATGSLLSEVIQAARNLMIEDIKTDIYCLRFLTGLDFDEIFALAEGRDGVVFVEDGVGSGGIGEALEQEFFKRGFTRTAVKALPERFLSQGTRSEICEATGLDPRSLAECGYKVVYKK